MRALIFVLIFCHTAVAHADLFDDRMATLGDKAEMTAQFIEFWHASYLKEPIKTTGQLQYRAPGILVKNVTGPEPAEYVVDGDTMTIHRDGEKQVVNISRHPELGAGFYAMRKILDGDREGLEKKFATQYQVNNRDPEKWVITLIPRNEKLAYKINKITVAGKNRCLNEINIIYTNGNKLITQIYNNDE